MVGIDNKNVILQCVKDTDKFKLSFIYRNENNAESKYLVNINSYVDS